MTLNVGASYGASIVRQIEAQESSVGRLYPANLFRRIRDLTERGLLAETDRPEDADTRRTYVRLTDLGQDVLQAEARRLEALVRDARAHDLIGDAK
ncbi:MAG: hypothetical protein GKS06_02755 [Acidobacteria bacterium]|nr:hypothetical protein [Acidobacteriota bacterium]